MCISRPWWLFIHQYICSLHRISLKTVYCLHYHRASPFRDCPSSISEPLWTLPQTIGFGGIPFSFYSGPLPFYPSFLEFFGPRFSWVSGLVPTLFLPWICLGAHGLGLPGICVRISNFSPFSSGLPFHKFLYSLGAIFFPHTLVYNVLGLGGISF